MGDLRASFLLFLQIKLFYRTENLGYESSIPKSFLFFRLPMIIIHKKCTNAYKVISTQFVVYFDLKRAFDTVNHGKLLSILNTYGFESSKGISSTHT